MLCLFFFLLPEDLSPVEKGKKIFLKTLPFWIVGILYTFFRFKIIGMVLSAGAGFPPPVLGLYSHILLVIKSIGYYLRLLFFPVYLCAERSLTIPKSFFEPDILIFVGVVIFLLVSAVALFRRATPLEVAHRAPLEMAYLAEIFLTGRATILLMGWIFFTILPAGNIYFLHTRPLAEQRLYLPSVGFCILLALVIAKIADPFSAVLRRMKLTQRAQRTSRRISLVFCGIAFFSVLAFYSVGTVRRNTDWHNSIVFWEKTVKNNPDSPRARINLGIAYSCAERDEEAIQELKKALDMGLYAQLAYFNLGIAYDNQGKTEEAVAMFEKVLTDEVAMRQFLRFLGMARVKGDFHLMPPAFVLGLFYETRGRDEKAIARYREALKISSNCVIAHYYLGKIYDRKGQDEDAIFRYQQVIKIKPDYPEIHKVYFNLGNIYRRRGQHGEAITHWEKAVEIEPVFLEVRRILGDVYKENGMYSQAIIQYEKLLEIDPKNWDACFNLGSIYMEKELYKEASEHYKKAIEYNPNFAQAHYNLGLLYLRFERFNDAAKEFEKVLYLEPRNIMAKKMYEFALESAKKGVIPREFHHP